MKKLILVGLILFSFSVSFALVSGETKDVAAYLGASSLSEIKFAQNNANLTAEQKEELRKAIEEAKKQGEITEVKVLSWSDKEYPLTKNQYQKQDVQLAKNRAKQVKEFIRKDLNADDVDMYNMAERPNKMSELFRTSDARIKETAETAGAAPRTKDETGLFGIKGQASKTVVMIFHNKN